MTVDYKIGLYARLRDPKYAAQYLAEAATDTDPEVFQLALRDVAAAHRLIPDPAKSAAMTVYILWERYSDYDPQIVEVYATREAAETAKANNAEMCICGHTLSHHRDGATGEKCYDCDCRAFHRRYSDLEIEEREVKS